MKNPFTIENLPPPPGTPGSAFRVGAWENNPLYLITEKLYVYNPDLQKFDRFEDQYRPMICIYDALRKRMGWQHRDAAQALKISRRTAEGFMMGRISKANRVAICQLVAGLSAPAQNT